jgi:hypothetical protein
MSLTFELDLACENFDLLETESGNNLAFFEILNQEAIDLINATPNTRLLDIVGDSQFPFSARDYAANVLSARSISQAFLWSNFYINDPFKAVAPIRGMIANRIQEQPDLAIYFPSY